MQASCFPAQRFSYQCRLDRVLGFCAGYHTLRAASNGLGDGLRAVLQVGNANASPLGAYFVNARLAMPNAAQVSFITIAWRCHAGIMDTHRKPRGTCFS